MQNPIWGNGIFKKKKKEDDIFTIQKQVPIFSDLNPKELTEVEKIVHWRRYKKNEAIIKAIDNAFISPIVVSKSVNMHPLTVVVAVIIGVNIAGAIGMLFAVPFTGILKVASSQVIWGIKKYELRPASLIQENLWEKNKK